MPRARIYPHKPPVKWWPPKPGSDEHEVVIVVTSEPDAQGLQNFWLRWHVGNFRGSNGWRIRRFERHSLRHIQAYWAMTGLRVTTEALLKK